MLKVVPFNRPVTHARGLSIIVPCTQLRAITVFMSRHVGRVMDE